MITAGKKYKKLIDRCALRPLTSDADLEVALSVSQQLLDRIDLLDNEEKDYLSVLGDLIEAYETERYPIPEAGSIPPAEMLRWLMEENNFKQVDLAPVLGVTSGRMSELVNGHRDLSKSQIMKLADFFKVQPGLFMSREKN